MKKIYLSVLTIILSMFSIAQSTTSPTVDTVQKAFEDSMIFTKAEVEAEFPGGVKEWIKYLQRNLNATVPADNGAPEGSYRVIVRFIVRKDGTISDIQAETANGFGTEQEVIRIIKTGPNWTPALQNGRPVNAYRRQPITFVVTEDGKKKKRKRG